MKLFDDSLDVCQTDFNGKQFIMITRIILMSVVLPIKKMYSQGPYF